MASIIEELNRIYFKEGDPVKEPMVFSSKNNFSNEQIIKIENDFDIVLPEDYKSILKEFGKVIIDGENSNLIFFDQKELYDIPSYPLDPTLDPVFVFGTDNGGYYYYYDINNLSGKGIFSVLMVYPGDLTLEDSRFLGKNLTETIEKIINGERFIRYPMIG